MMTFSEPTRITARYRIVTPMFLGGDGHHVDDQYFRNASFKGALRFWWRALNWGQVLKDANGNTDAALTNLHAAEGRLFGKASDGEEGSRQSSVSLRSTLQGAKVKQPGQGLAQIGYLLGQGLHHFNDGILRQYLEGGSLELTLQFKPRTVAADIESVRKAAIALGLFGGLGSRSRRGLGSLSIDSIELPGQDTQSFTTQQSIQDFIATLDFSAPGNAPLTALSQSSRIDVSLTDSSALAALTKVSNEMQMYRSYGKDEKILGKEARRNFTADHNLAQTTTEGKKVDRLPERIVFGLPHNYFFSSTKSKADITVEDEGRRASPLFIHIHALENEQFAAIQTLLPGEFIRKDMLVEIKSKSKQKLPASSADYAVIHDYLDGGKGIKDARDSNAFAQRQTLNGASRG